MIDYAVACFTSDINLWALRPFIHLYDKFWKKPLSVFGYKKPEFDLPDYLTFYSISDQQFPPERWSDAFMVGLQTLQQKYVVILLEDYWLIRDVNFDLIDSLVWLMDDKVSKGENILRIDLTCDRLHAYGDARNSREYGMLKSYDIITTPHPCQYRMSLQAGLWNRSELLELVKPNMSPWEIELYLQPKEDALVLGTRQWPVRYINAILKGQIDKFQIGLMPGELLEEIMPLVPEDKRGELT